MTTADLSIPEQFKHRVQVAMGDAVRRVVLFGSRARGDWREESDWDFAVFLDRDPTWDDRAAISDVGFDLMMDNDGVPIQTIAFSAAKAEDDNYLMRNIRADGITL